MPGMRALASSLFAGVVVGLVAYLWLRWPGFLAVSTGALFGVASLIVTGSLETHGAAADEAWRKAAPDLHARIAASTDPDRVREVPPPQVTPIISPSDDSAGDRAGEQAARSRAAVDLDTAGATREPPG